MLFRSLADVFSMGRTGAEVQSLLDMANITANKNTIPKETLSVKVTSGMRFGTPAVTTRGMRENEMRRIASMITDVIKGGEEAVPAVRQKVIELTSEFPLYEGII
mgnify:CR=1 FL=1